jgi:PAS domain-containing protein
MSGGATNEYASSAIATVSTERRESEQRVRDFSEVASDWFWETDAEHRFTYESENVSR